jgi:hypothetical protein
MLKPLRTVAASLAAGLLVVTTGGGTAVPLPGTLALMGLAGLALVATRGRFPRD